MRLLAIILQNKRSHLDHWQSSFHQSHRRRPAWSPVHDTQSDTECRGGSGDQASHGGHTPTLLHCQWEGRDTWRHVVIFCNRKRDVSPEHDYELGIFIFWSCYLPLPQTEDQRRFFVHTFNSPCPIKSLSCSQLFYICRIEFIGKYSREIGINGCYQSPILAAVEKSHKMTHYDWMIWS